MLSVKKSENNKTSKNVSKTVRAKSSTSNISNNKTVTKVTDKKKSLTSLTPTKGKSSNIPLQQSKSKGNIPKPLDKSNVGLFSDKDFEELTQNGHLEDAFKKFWKEVTEGMDKYPFTSVPRNTPIDNKISDIKKRIQMNQMVLQTANERMKNINFKVERENLNQWKSTSSFTDIAKDAPSFESLEAMETEVEKLRQNLPDRSLGLKAIPGVSDFHKTMKNTLDILDKIQNKEHFKNYESTYQEIKKDFDFNKIQSPRLIEVSDEE